MKTNYLKLFINAITILGVFFFLTCLDGTFSFLNPLNIFRSTRAELQENVYQLQEELSSCTGDLSVRKDSEDQLKKKTWAEWGKSLVGTSEHYEVRQASIDFHQSKLDSLRKGYTVTD